MISAKTESETHLGSIIDFARKNGFSVNSRIVNDSSRVFSLTYQTGYKLKIETDLAYDFPLLYLQDSYIFGLDKSYSEKDWRWFEKNSKTIIFAVIISGYKEIEWYKGKDRVGGIVEVIDKGGKKIKLRDWSGPNFSFFYSKKIAEHTPLE